MKAVETALRFLGRKVCRLFLIGLVVGVALFGVELAFAYTLQSFLKALGILESSDVALPWWVPQGRFQTVLLFFFAIGAARTFLQWSQVYLQICSGEEFVYLLRKRILHWAFDSPSMNSGRVVTLINNRASAAATAAQQVQIILVQLSCGMLIGISLLVIAPSLTALSFLVLALFLLPIRSFDKKIDALGKAVTQESELLNCQLMTCLKNLLFVHLYGTQRSEELKARSRAAALLDHSLSYAAYMAGKFALPQFVGVILICVIAYSVRKYIAIKPAGLISFLYLFVRFTQTLSSVAQTASTLQLYKNQVLDIVKWWRDNSHDGMMNRHAIDIPPNVKQVPSAVGWNLKNVTFAYPNAREPTIQSLSLTVKPGACLVIIGPSGVGKSTLLNIMLGGLAPQKGSVDVFLRGAAAAVPLSTIRPALLKGVGYVGPESFLIDDTIHGNLVYGLSECPTDEQVLDACRKAGCQFVFELPRGLRHFITEQGQGLSAGQKQRLSLARALLRQPKVLVLDEATSNLDSETEEKIVEFLGGVKGHTTVIAVTHRKALLKIADEALQLKGSVQ